MPRISMRLLGEHVREAREAAGLTIEAAAKRMDVAEAYLEQVESGQRPMTLERIAVLSEALHTPMAGLLNGILEADED